MLNIIMIEELNEEMVKLGRSHADVVESAIEFPFIINMRFTFDNRLETQSY